MKVLIDKERRHELYDFFVSADARTVLMERVMRRFGVDRLLKHMPNHAAVTSRAVDRCRACGHQTQCTGWLDKNEHPGEPPDIAAIAISSHGYARP